MSYEGYTQNICSKGHMYAQDVYEDDNACPMCGSVMVWHNSVDQTNCDEIGIITPEGWETLRLTPEKVETCNLGHKHITEHATYRIPSKEELAKLRSFWDETSATFRLLSSITVYRCY